MIPLINKANSTLCTDSLIEQHVQNKNKAGWLSFLLFLCGATARGVSSRTELAFAPEFGAGVLPQGEQKHHQACNAQPHLRQWNQNLQGWARDPLFPHTLQRAPYMPWSGITASEKLTDRVEALARECTHSFGATSVPPHTPQRPSRPLSGLVRPFSPGLSEFITTTRHIMMFWSTTDRIYGTVVP